MTDKLLIANHNCGSKMILLVPMRNSTSPFQAISHTLTKGAYHGILWFAAYLLPNALQNNMYGYLVFYWPWNALGNKNKLQIRLYHVISYLLPWPVHVTIGIKFGYECFLGKILHEWYRQAISCTRHSRVQEWRLSVSRVQDFAAKAQVTKLDFFSNS